MIKFLNNLWFVFLACGLSHIYIGSLIQIYGDMLVGFIATLIISLIGLIFISLSEYLINKYKSKKDKQ